MDPAWVTAIRIGPKVRHWREGEVLIFDDAHEHETWKNAAHPSSISSNRCGSPPT
jgi:hypothetical protein